MSEKHNTISPGAVQVRNQWETIGFEEKLDVISQLEKGEQIVDIRCTVRQAHSSVHTVCHNADRITECAEYLDNIKCQQSW